MIARLGLLGAVWLVTSGSYYSCTAGNSRPLDPGDGSGFTAILILRDSNGAETTSFMFGEPIRFDLNVTNRTDQAVTVHFNDGHQSDFLAVDSGTHNLRWLWSQGLAFTQATTEFTFDANSTRTITVTWNGILANGTQLMPGTYQARGGLVASSFPGDPMAESDMVSPLKGFVVR